MPPLPELLELHKTAHPAAKRPKVVAIIGSGGKTTLLWLLAQSLRRHKVLVSTTVKMRPPQPGQADFIVGCPEVQDLVPHPGVTFAAVSGENGKVTSLPLPLLDTLYLRFDISLLESDGAGERPYKGWAEHEPVVPDAVTLTIAVMPVPLPGWTASENLVHRLPLFCAITGAHVNDALRPEHLARAIAHPGGLLEKTKGNIILFFNQVENPTGEKFARETISLLPETCRKRLARIILGSAQKNSGNVV
jgi:probable selenium-dependent hydroxylase accessory protein YqeC